MASLRRASHLCQRCITGTQRPSIVLAMRGLSSGPPMQPPDFGKGFRLEPYTSKLALESFNVHPRDKRMVFDDANHSYYFDGVKSNVSVTEKVNSYFEIFDKDRVVDNMINGSNWPRAGYLTSDGTPFTKDEILEKWDNIGTFARNKGTWLHYNIERHFNNMDVSPNLSEMSKFYKFEEKYLTQRGIKPYRTEWKLFGEDEMIAGTVDFVGKKEDGTYVIMDWKTTANMSQKFTNAYNKVAREPLDHLHDCDGQKYALQLNIYRFLLQKYYGLEVSEMRIASFAYKEPSYFTTTVHVMDSEIDLIFPPTEDELNEAWDDSDKEEDSDNWK